MAFHLGVQQLGQQLLGREPFSDVSNLRDDSEKSAYYWRYGIYYHVSDKAAGLWMGHVQIYLEAYEWTLGLYYYIDPNGDLRLMYYSVTPSDGYVAEEAIWPKFVPYEWMSDERKLIA
ncbi:unnamed protein product [Cyprideis torosa]|uniref:Uncharacterized protein n=1 Tax=Cyprideis torosa TaxID=163714 RepID=A0A7R8W3R2_9CRUS|nr:unnamed protein product [Cyprideis torosa]CAG0883291.1 unnamed protein product [Cyprideis torosa]